jgi:hypothetical protein
MIPGRSLDFIPKTMDASHVKTAPLVENNNPLAENLAAEPSINEIREHI